MFLIFLSFSILAHSSRLIYERLKHTGRIEPENRVVFAWMTINMFLMWFSWIVMCQLDPWKPELPVWLSYAGLAVAAAGVVIFAAAFIQTRSVENYSGPLVTTGLYRYIRHPMYFSFILWLVGVPVFFGAGVSFLSGIVFAVNVCIWKMYEEKALMAKYPEYSGYRKRTLF